MCHICSKKVWKTKDVLNKTRKRFCSYNCFSKAFIGKNSPRYRHGLRGGYTVININGEQVAKHRVVMEKKLGRKIRRFEFVHHKNGLKWDWRIQNLELWTIRKDPPGQRVKDILKFVKKYYHKEYMTLCK